MKTISSPQSIDNICPDPWQWETSTNLNSVTPKSWPIAKDMHPLISPAGIIGAKQLSSTTLNPIELLLWDWLKLKIEQTKQFTNQFQEALALLCWLEAKPQKSS